MDGRGVTIGGRPSDSRFLKEDRPFEIVDEVDHADLRRRWVGDADDWEAQSNPRLLLDENVLDAGPRGAIRHWQARGLLPMKAAHAPGSRQEVRAGGGAVRALRRLDSSRVALVQQSFAQA